MSSLERAQCEGWEQAIIDGAHIGQLSDFNPELMLTYWQAEGFRMESLEPLRAQFSDWFKSLRDQEIRNRLN
jgi:hypothetical protein